MTGGWQTAHAVEYIASPIVGIGREVTVRPLNHPRIAVPDQSGDLKQREPGRDQG